MRLHRGAGSSKPSLITCAKSTSISNAGTNTVDVLRFPDTALGRLITKFKLKILHLQFNISRSRRLNTLAATRPLKHNEDTRQQSGVYWNGRYFFRLYGTPKYKMRPNS